jgi:hypothetical protein
MLPAHAGQELRDRLPAAERDHGATGVKQRTDPVGGPVQQAAMHPLRDDQAGQPGQVGLCEIGKVDEPAGQMPCVLRRGKRPVVLGGAAVNRSEAPVTAIDLRFPARGFGDGPVEERPAAIPQQIAGCLNQDGAGGGHLI